MVALSIQPPQTTFEIGMSDRRAAERSNQLDQFLRGLERRALRIAEMAIGHREDALDAVQDAMLNFVRSYAMHSPTEWTPLFYRVLDNRLLDHHRRHQVRSKWLAWLPSSKLHEDDELNPIEQVEDPHALQPLQLLHDENTRVQLDLALRALPHRQRQAFLLRVWEGLDVADTARAMACSEGSVKTHLSRAMAVLRLKLENCR